MSYNIYNPILGTNNTVYTVDEAKHLYNYYIEELYKKNMKLLYNCDVIKVHKIDNDTLEEVNTSDWENENSIFYRSVAYKNIILEDINEYGTIKNFNHQYKLWKQFSDVGNPDIFSKEISPIDISSYEKYKNREYQYENDVLKKINHPFCYNDFVKLFFKMRENTKFPKSYIPRFISEKDGKLTAFFSNKLLFNEMCEEYPFLNDYKSFLFFSISFIEDKIIHKIFYPISDLDESEKEIVESVIDKLPKTSTNKFGIAISFTEGVKDEISEVFFADTIENVKMWADSLGMVVPNIDFISYYGIKYDKQGNILPILKSIKKEIILPDAVEYCWFDGTKRISYDINSEIGKQLYSKFRTSFDSCDKNKLLYQEIDKHLTDAIERNFVSNISVQNYNLGDYGSKDIFSIYVYGDVPSTFRVLYNVPDSIKTTFWTGIKYCSEYKCSWLKICDWEIEKYDIPELPVNSKVLNIALTFPEKDNQPLAYNYSKSTNDVVDLSFYTNDIKSVREWCDLHSISDPNPDSPNYTNLYTVYSFTYNSKTNEVIRLKSYEYLGEQLFEMEEFLSFLDMNCYNTIMNLEYKKSINWLSETRINTLKQLCMMEQ